MKKHFKNTYQLFRKSARNSGGKVNQFLLERRMEFLEKLYGKRTAFRLCINAQEAVKDKYQESFANA